MNMRVLFFVLLLPTTTVSALSVEQIFTLSPENAQTYGFEININSDSKQKCANISVPVPFRNGFLHMVKLTQKKDDQDIFHTILFYDNNFQTKRKVVSFNFCATNITFSNYSLGIHYAGYSNPYVFIENFTQFEKAP